MPPRSSWCGARCAWCSAAEATGGRTGAGRASPHGDSGGIKRGLKRPRPTMPRIMLAPTSHSNASPSSTTSDPDQGEADPASTRPVGRIGRRNRRPRPRSRRRALTGEIGRPPPPAAGTPHTSPGGHHQAHHHGVRADHQPGGRRRAPRLVTVPRRIAAAARPRHSPTPEARKPSTAAPPSTERNSGDRDDPMQRAGPAPCAVAPPGC